MKNTGYRIGKGTRQFCNACNRSTLDHAPGCGKATTGTPYLELLQRYDLNTEVVTTPGYEACPHCGYTVHAATCQTQRPTPTADSDGWATRIDKPYGLAPTAEPHRFQPGDRVRCVDSNGTVFLKAGASYDVVSVERGLGDDRLTLRELETVVLGYRASRFIPAPVEPAPDIFHVGQLVKCVLDDDVGGLIRGDVYTVCHVDWDNKRLRVVEDPYQGTYRHASRFVPVSVEPALRDGWEHRPGSASITDHYYHESGFCVSKSGDGIGWNVWTPAIGHRPADVKDSLLEAMFKAESLVAAEQRKDEALREGWTRALRHEHGERYEHESGYSVSKSDALWVAWVVWAPGEGGLCGIRNSLTEAMDAAEHLACRYGRRGIA